MLGEFPSHRVRGDRVGLTQTQAYLGDHPAHLAGEGVARARAVRGPRGTHLDGLDRHPIPHPAAHGRASRHAVTLWIWRHGLISSRYQHCTYIHTYHPYNPSLPLSSTHVPSHPPSETAHAPIPGYHQPTPSPTVTQSHPPPSPRHPTGQLARQRRETPEQSHARIPADTAPLHFTSPCLRLPSVPPPAPLPA